MDNWAQSDKEFAGANRAIDKAANAIVNDVNKLLNKPYRWVARDYLVKGLLLALLRDHDVTAMLDQMALPGQATLVLSNALLDYRDARRQDQ